MVSRFMQATGYFPFFRQEMTSFLRARAQSVYSKYAPIQIVNECAGKIH